MNVKEYKYIDSFYSDNSYTLKLAVKKDFFPVVIYNNKIILKNSEENHKHPQYIIEIKEKDLVEYPFWDHIFCFYQKNYIKISYWWKNNFSKLNPEGLFYAFQWANNYKTRSEWEEWSYFSKNSEIILDYYDFSIQTIRLWDRLPVNIQNIWLEILSIFLIKKNLFREIINDIYDLSYDEQKDISFQCLKLAQKYKNEQKHSIFPQDEIRDLVKSKRYPLFYKRKKESYILKKKIENYIPQKNFDILIPEDLESSPIELKIYLKKINDLENILFSLQNPEIKEYIKNLIQHVFE